MALAEIAAHQPDPDRPLRDGRMQRRRASNRTTATIAHGPPMIGPASLLEPIHSFDGVNPALDAILFAASGSSQAPQEVADAFQTAGVRVTINPQRGLDHGAWLPLRDLFPAADVPELPLSMQHPGGPEQALRVGQDLAPLAHRISSPSVRRSPAGARRFAIGLHRWIESAASRAGAMVSWWGDDPSVPELRPGGATFNPEQPQPRWSLQDQQRQNP